jgi:hypothetical protein
MQRTIKTITGAVARLRSLSETIAAPPSGRARTITSILIGAYLLWQVCVPLTYYFGGDKFDERFAWRMFSGLGWNLKKCSVTVRETRVGNYREQPLAQDIEVEIGDWVTMLILNRAVVVDRFLRRSCEKSPWTMKVELVLFCPTVGGRMIQSGYLELNCITGDLTQSGP